MTDDRLIELAHDCHLLHGSDEAVLRFARCVMAEAAKENRSTSMPILDNGLPATPEQYPHFERLAAIHRLQTPYDRMDALRWYLIGMRQAERELALNREKNEPDVTGAWADMPSLWLYKNSPPGEIMVSFHAPAQQNAYQWEPFFRKVQTNA